MADVQPLRALRYDLRTVGSLDSVASESTASAGGGVVSMPDSESTAVICVEGFGPSVGAAGSAASGAQGGGEIRAMQQVGFRPHGPADHAPLFPRELRELVTLETF